MFEIFFFNMEEKVEYVRIFLFTLFISLIIGFINYFMGGNYLFLIALISLFLAYPVVKFILTEDQEEFRFRINEKVLIKRHEREMMIFLMIFLAAIVSFLVLTPFISQSGIHEDIYSELTGNITINDGFYFILINNLIVAFFTFIISFISLSGLIFVLVWNASVVSYYVSSFFSLKDSFLGLLGVLGHGVFEVFGYILIGLAGSLFAYRISKNRKFNFDLNKEFIFDFAFLTLISIVFIVLGAFLEVL